MSGKDASYWALVKFLVHADHFSTAFTFNLYLGDSKAEVGRALANDFSARVDEALQHTEIDNEIIADRERLKKLTRPFLAKTARKALPKLRSMATEVYVGYASHSMEILAEGEREVFFASFPISLEQDTHFTSVRDWGDPDDPQDPYVRLYDDLKRIKQTALKDMSDSDVGLFLSELQERFHNDTM